MTETEEVTGMLSCFLMFFSVSPGVPVVPFLEVSEGLAGPVRAISGSFRVLKSLFCCLNVT